MKELQYEYLAEYWYLRCCKLVTESTPPTAEKAYYVEKLKEAEGEIKALQAENETLSNIIDNFRFKQL